MVMIHDQHHGKPETAPPSLAGSQHWITDPDSNDIIGHLKEGTLGKPTKNPYAATASRAEGRRNSLPAADIIQWAAETFRDSLVMSTSFGIQSAVMLHLVREIAPNIPVIWIDTGYFPTQTYLFAEQLTKRLRLNLKVYQPAISPARMEALYGKPWELAPTWHRYHQIRQVEPMQRALQELKATAWLIGVRKRLASSPQSFHVMNIPTQCYKILPMLHWQVQDIQKYIRVHDLPEHPFFELGAVGDKPLREMRDKCDRNLPAQTSQADGNLPITTTPQVFQSLDSSGL